MGLIIFLVFLIAGKASLLPWWGWLLLIIFLEG